MRHCAKCGVDVRGDYDRCPLCQSPLTGEAEAPRYPEVKTVYRQFRQLLRIVLLCAISAAAVSVAINLMLPETGHWSLYVLLALGCFLWCLLMCLRKLHNIPQVITSQTLFITVLSVVWDLVIGWQGWSIEYAIPLTCISAMAAMAIVAQVRHMPASDYGFWMVINIVFGIAPVVFYLTGILDDAIPSLICVTACVISLAAMVLFQGGAIRQEIIKRFHI